MGCEDAFGEVAAFADFDVVGDVLAGRDVGERFVHLADDVEDDADVGGYTNLGP